MCPHALIFNANSYPWKTTPLASHVLKEDTSHHRHFLMTVRVKRALAMEAMRQKESVVGGFSVELVIYGKK
jgi:negative regulator of sigma E activity